MKNLALVSLILIALTGPSVAADSTRETALQGDYQAQRNLAYSFATGTKDQKKDVEQACSWYLLIVRSDSPKLNAGDIGNVVTYCEKLDFDKRLLAERNANAWFRKIYQK